MNKSKFSDFIKNFKFKELFIELGWDNLNTTTPITADEEIFNLKGIVEKRGFVFVLCPPTSDGKIPLSNTRKKIEREFTKIHEEHLIIYTNAEQTNQIWQFIVKEPDKPRKVREIQYEINKDAEILYQRARGLLFTLDEEENITLIDVKSRFKETFGKNTEKVTKKFYTEFKKHHTAFLAFISGIEDFIKNKDNKNKQWYASLMLNRLMFCYFIQKRGYLDGNLNYLQDKLAEVKNSDDKFHNFYRDFLLQLFHQGLGKPETQRKTSVELGNIPYLNGGLFDVHELEKQFAHIDIKDEAFEEIFNFFDQWNWHLDTRVESTGKDINPDVIGYIFEKYINDRAAMGAYYTKEDITDYIGKNTVIPFLFDKVKETYSQAFDPYSFVWQWLKDSGDTYIYDAVKHGIPDSEDIFADLLEQIQAGFNPELEQQIITDDSPHLYEIRMPWNKKAPEDIALPTEIYREVIERRKRYKEVLNKIENGEITEINDFITYNLNIRQFIQDILTNIDDPDFIRHFYNALQQVTILDPTCGSGAFLFAAMNILETLYETCIERMEQYVSEEPRSHRRFNEILADANSQDHPNLQYFIYKTIILNNLYGVDIMHEAVEIAKLRLFLKMIGSVDINHRKANLGLEPLPDVDFNIRAGNTLVGFATEEELKNAVMHDIDNQLKLGWQNEYKDVEDQCTVVSTAFREFHNSQLLNDRGNNKSAKAELQNRLNDLNEKLNEHLAKSYGIDKTRKPKQYEEWLDSHQPFHWFVEFYEIINQNQGFDVIIGNPPYIENSKINYSINNYTTIDCGNLYAFMMERSKNIINNFGYISMIVPLSGHSTKRMTSLINNFYFKFTNCFIINLSGDAHPSKLFEGVKFRLSIFICNDNYNGKYTTKYNRWYSEERENLFNSQIIFNLLKDKYATAIPKELSMLYHSIIKKVYSNSKSIYYNAGDQKMFYHNTPVNWIRAHSFVPYFKSDRDGKKVSTQLKPIKYDTKIESQVATTIICSSIFFIHWIANSDCYHLNKPEVVNFKFNWTETTNIKLSIIEKKLSKDIKNKSIRRVYIYKTSGKVEYDEYYMKKSKSIIDKIDTILAQHYHFTEEELDFIINYDIKYRMGDELNAYIETYLEKE